MFNLGRERADQSFGYEKIKEANKNMSTEISSDGLSSEEICAFLPNAPDPVDYLIHPLAVAIRTTFEFVSHHS